MSIRRLMLLFAHVYVAQLLVGDVAFLWKTILYYGVLKYFPTFIWQSKSGVVNKMKIQKKPTSQSWLFKD